MIRPGNLVTPIQAARRGVKLHPEPRDNLSMAERAHSPTIKPGVICIVVSWIPDGFTTGIILVLHPSGKLGWNDAALFTRVDA